MTPPLLTTTHDGVDGEPIAVEASSESPGAVLVHANGFCKELWRPVTSRSQALSEIGWVALDQRGQGDSTVGAPPYLWDTVARDVLSVVDAVGNPRIGVGHSSGGAAVARAEILNPGTFDTLVLIEPIVFPPPHGRADLRLATIAELRRAVFADRAAAHARFAGGPFASWTPEALDLYVDHAFRATDEGWALKCAPGVEADYYREGNNVDTWERLHEIDAPVTIVAGGTSDTHQNPYLGELVNQFQDGTLVVLDDIGHLVPMEAPGLVAQTIDRALAGE